MAYGRGVFPTGARSLTGELLTKAFRDAFQGGITRKSNITAKAGGTKARAVQLISSLNLVSVCASANDSALLPAAIPGSLLVLINVGAQTLAFYGKGSDKINGNPTANASTLAAASGIILACVTKGAWWTVGTAPHGGGPVPPAGYGFVIDPISGAYVLDPISGNRLIAPL